MKREWKPGDVAEYDGRRVMFAGAFGDCCWIDDEGDERSNINPDLGFRPLVVIDPEDREAVERLFRLYVGQGGIVYAEYRRDYLQSALREFANPTPPRPPEPLGLGAVVEDAHGILWVRVSHSTHPWRSVEDERRRARWADIDAVEVKAPGWSQ